MKLQGKRGGSDFRFFKILFSPKKIEFIPACCEHRGCFSCLALLLFVTKQHQPKEFFGTSLVASKQLPCYGHKSQHQEFALNFRSSCERLRILNNNIIINNNSISLHLN